MTTLPPDTNPAPDELPETASDAPLPSPDQHVPRRQRRRRSSAIEPNQEVSDSPAPAPSSVPAKAESSEPEPVELIASTTASDGSEEDDPSDDCQDIPKNQSFVFVENIEWTLSRMGKSHKIHLIQPGRDVTGHYTKINNDSQFHGTVTRATRNSDAIFVDFTQTSPTSDYRATQTGQVVHPYLITGEWEDNRGNQGRFTLQGRAIPAPVAPEVGLDKEPESPQPVDLSQLPEIQRLKEMARLYPELLQPELGEEDDEDEDTGVDPRVPLQVDAEWQWVLTASTLANANLQAAKLAGADLRGKDLSGANLSRADLRHCNLTDAKLTGANLKRADLSHANLTNTDLREANLERSHLAHAVLNRTNLEAAQLVAADLERADLYNPKINGANFNQANLRYTSLELMSGAQQVNFICAHFDGAEVPHSFGLHHCDCRWATFRHVIFSRSRDENDQIDDRGLGMSQCNLQHTDWLGADLNGFEFQTSILRQARFDRADLDDAQFMQCDLQGVDLRYVTTLPTFQECDLSRVNLRGQQGSLKIQRCNLSGADLTGFSAHSPGAWCQWNLSGVQIDASTQWDTRWQVIWEVQNQGRKHDLAGADLRYVQLTDLDLSGADLSGADLSGAWVAYTNLAGANLTGANLTNTRFAYGANLSQTDLRQAHWEQYPPRFENCNLAHARFDGLNLSACLSGQPNSAGAYLDLSGVNLANADLSRSTLRNAKLHQTMLTNANLAQVNFQGADLTGADLSGADLTNADLSQANLTEANLSNANLTETKLYQTKLYQANLTRALLRDTQFNQTKFQNTNCAAAKIQGKTTVYGFPKATHHPYINLEGADFEE